MTNTWHTIDSVGDEEGLDDGGEEGLPVGNEDGAPDGLEVG